MHAELRDREKRYLGNRRIRVWDRKSKWITGGRLSLVQRMRARVFVNIETPMEGLSYGHTETGHMDLVLADRG